MRLNVLCLALLALVGLLAASAQAQPVQPEPLPDNGVCGQTLQQLYGLTTVATTCTPTAFGGEVIVPGSLQVTPAPTGEITTGAQGVGTVIRVRVDIRQRPSPFTCSLVHRALQTNANYYAFGGQPSVNVPSGAGTTAFDTLDYVMPTEQTIPFALTIQCNPVPGLASGSQTTQFVARFTVASPALVVGQASLSPSPAADGASVTVTATIARQASDTLALQRRAAGTTGAFTTVTTTTTAHTTTLASASFNAASADDNFEYKFVATRPAPAQTVDGAVSAAHRVVSSGASSQTHASTVVGDTTMTFTVTGITGGAGATATLWTVGAPDAQVTAAMCTVTGASATCTVPAVAAHDNRQFRIVVANGGASFSSTPTAVQRVVAAGNPTAGPIVILPGAAQSLTATASGAGTITWQRRTGIGAFADYTNMNCQQVTTAGSQTMTCAVGNTAADDNFEYQVRSFLTPDSAVSGTPTLVRVVSAGATTFTHTSPIAQGATMTFQITGITGGATVATLRTTTPDAVVASATCGAISAGAATCTLTADGAAHEGKQFRIAVAAGAVNFVSSTPTTPQQVVSTGATTTATSPVAAGNQMTFSTSGITGGATTVTLESSSTVMGTYTAVTASCPAITAGATTATCTVSSATAAQDNLFYRIVVANGAVTSASTTPVQHRVVSTGATTTATSPVAAGGNMVFSTSAITGGATVVTLQSSSTVMGTYTAVTASCPAITAGATTATCTVSSATAAQDNLFYRIVVGNGAATFPSATPVQHRVVSTGATTSLVNPILTTNTMTFSTSSITGGVTNGISLQTFSMGNWIATVATCNPIAATDTTASCTLAAAPTHDNQLFRIVVAIGMVSFPSATPVTQQVVSAASPTPASVRAITVGGVGGTQLLTVQASGAGGAGAGTIVWQRKLPTDTNWAAYANCPTVTTPGNQAALTCTVTGVAGEDNYQYRVLSTNGVVSQPSATPVLIRVVAITTQPADKVIAENTAGNPMFTADGHGDGTFEWQYQKPMDIWRVVGAVPTDFPTGLSGQATKQLTFTSANNAIHDQWKFRLRVYNTQCATCGTGGTVEAVSNAATLTVVAVTLDPTNRVVVSGGSTNPAYSFIGINFQTQRWQQNCVYTAPAETTLTSTQWTNIGPPMGPPAETAATLTVATSNTNALAGAKNGCLYRVVIKHTASGVESQSEPASLREVFYTMAGTKLAHRAKYDYYATGSVLTAPFTEQQLALDYSANNLQVISNVGVRSDQSCTLTLKYSVASGRGNAAVNTITTGNVLAQTFTLGTITSPGAIAITAVPSIANTPNPTLNGLIGHTQARALNGGLLSLSCVTETGPYSDSGTLTLYYPPLLSTAPNQRWSANPANFATNGYADFPEPGHWNYRSTQVARLEFLFDGNPTVIGVAATVAFNFKDAAGAFQTVTVGTPNPNVPQASVAAPALSTVVVTDTVPVASALTIAPLSITQARENYHNKILSVTAVFPTIPTDATPGAAVLTPFAGFTRLVFQPTSYMLDAGVLSPHYPPVLITVEPLTSEETNFPDTGVYRWPTRVLFHGFPKHDSQFGNAPYSTQPAPAVSVFPKRNYDQKLEYRSHDGTSYRTVTLPDRNYREATAAVQPAPTITLVASTNPNIPGVLEANSVIPSNTVTPMRMYNKWVYRWVLGVYLVNGDYEVSYSPGKDQADYLYYGVSGGFLGIWNWYPREFVPALCPTVMGPYALGTPDQLVTPATLSATMYPRPAAGVLAWDYAHHTANQWSLVDMTQPSTTLTGVANGESPLLPAVPGVNHLFKSTFTVVESTVPSVLPTVGVPEIIGFEVKCEGRINSILSSDANSIITPKYTHTLPDLLGATKGQRTIRGFPNMVLTNNCKQVATLSTAAATPTTVTHRGGETLVFEFAAGTGTVQVQVKDSQDGAAMFVTAFSVTLNPAQTTTKQWTTRYKSDKTPVTATSVQLNVAVTPAVKVHTHEYSNIPVNWPFAAANAVLPAGPAANEALTQCIAPLTVAANANANLAALTQQYHGCGTASPTTAPAGNGC